MRLRNLVVCLVTLALATPVSAATPDLSALATQLTKVRTTHGVNKFRDAGPELTPVKQALRLWVEQQLPPAVRASGPHGEVYLLDPDDLVSLSVRLSEALENNGLTCGQPGTPAFRCAGEPDGQENERGYVDKVRITQFDDDRYLMVVTGVGVSCGFDQSAYLYEQGTDHHWHLLMSIEQDRYGEPDYKPENFLALDVSAAGKAWNEPAPPPLVAAIGYQPSCASNWNMINTRLWRASRSTPTPHAILDRDDGLFTGSDFIAAARLSDHDLLIQFEGESIDSDILIRPHVLHFAIGHADVLKRIAPVALGPGDFVEEWLTSPWEEASRWSSPKANKPALASLHKRAYNHSLFGEFSQTPRQCRNAPGLWQVSFAADADSQGREIRPDYFLVKWEAPYDFTLVATSAHPFPGCDKEAALPSDIGTLFPIQGWTP